MGDDEAVLADDGLWMWQFEGVPSEPDSQAVLDERPRGGQANTGQAWIGACRSRSRRKRKVCGYWTNGLGNYELYAFKFNFCASATTFGEQFPAMKAVAGLNPIKDKSACIEGIPCQRPKQCCHESESHGYDGQNTTQVVPPYDDDCDSKQYQCGGYIIPPRGDVEANCSYNHVYCYA
jgi:hypothetical protein